MDFRDGAHKLSHCIVTKYKSLHSGKVRYLAIVIESEEAYQISKVVKLLQWLDSIGVKEFSRIPWRLKMTNWMPIRIALSSACIMEQDPFPTRMKLSVVIPKDATSNSNFSLS
ncbi:hypothetical protein JHK84_040037 [Glycine max]|nr:hypothetical protein JHK84_040037 [Glycine max]